MKQGLMDAFRNISWDKVLGAAPAISDAARKLWQRVAGASEAPSLPAAAPALNPELLAAIDVRIGPLQQRMQALEQESRASFEVVRSMAEQHTQLVNAVDMLLSRTQWLLRLAVLLGAAVIVLAVLLAMRW
jgi:phage-related minor tail protein